MLKKSTLLHLRIPFSFFLMPVFLFAFSLSLEVDLLNLFLVFISLHIFLYPASNGYNSYFDKDEQSIGGLKKPPPVDRQLYYTAIAFDLVALVLAIFVGWFYFFSLLIYGFVSKAYSHPIVRLKKFPVIGLLVIGVFQGFLIFIVSYQAINDLQMAELLQWKVIFPGILSTVLLWGSYPMTQIYQHEEDAKRGDKTISLKLGVKGTFLFTAVVFTLANAGFFYFYVKYFSLSHAIFFQLFLLPVLVFFLYWFFMVLRNKKSADFKNTMRLNLISSLCLNTFFILFGFICNPAYVRLLQDIV